jgi:hypothetical protein
MAEDVESSGVSSHILSKSNGNIYEPASKKCSEYETQLTEVLNEHGMALTIMEILQKELLTSTSTRNAYDNNLVSTEGFGKQVNTKEWTLVT